MRQVLGTVLTYPQMLAAAWRRVSDELRRAETCGFFYRVSPALADQLVELFVHAVEQQVSGCGVFGQGGRLQSELGL